jgi:hypothetical protein
MSLSNYASGLSIEAKTRYLGKLQMFNSDCPYCIPNSLWKHGLDCCPIVPKIAPSDIFIYLVETKSYQNHVAGLLQVCMVSSQINEQISCTEEMCTWSGTYSKPVIFVLVYLCL